MVSQDWRLIVAAILSGSRIPISCYYCTWYACRWVQHEGDCESQGQIGGRILNERLWVLREKFLEWGSVEREKMLLKVSQAEYVRKALKRFTWQMLNLWMSTRRSLQALGGRDSDYRRCLGSHIRGAICINCGQPDVCYGLHDTRHCSSSESCHHIHEQPWEGALESCEVDLEISKGQFRYNVVLWRHDRSAVGICWLRLCGWCRQSEEYHWLCLHFGKWSCELGVEAVEDIVLSTTEA